MKENNLWFCLIDYYHFFLWNMYIHHKNLQTWMYIIQLQLVNNAAAALQWTSRVDSLLIIASGLLTSCNRGVFPAGYFPAGYFPGISIFTLLSLNNMHLLVKFLLHILHKDLDKGSRKLKTTTVVFNWVITSEPSEWNSNFLFCIQTLDEYHNKLQISSFGFIIEG